MWKYNLEIRRTIKNVLICGKTIEVVTWDNNEPNQLENSLKLDSTT